MAVLVKGLSVYIFQKHLPVSRSTSRRTVCGQNISLQVKLFKSLPEYTVNRGLHKKLLGKHKAFVNSEICTMCSIINDGLSRLKHRVTHLHRSSSDSHVCPGQSQLTVPSFYLKVYRKRKGYVRYKLIDTPRRSNNMSAQSWDVIISMSQIIKFELWPITIHQAKIMKSWSLASRIKPILLYFQLEQSNICVTKQPSLVQ